MLPTDRRAEWDDHLLNDSRVIHLWDEDKVSGGFFGAEYEHRPNWIQWDAHYLFGRGARWSDASDKLLGSGRTVVGRSDDLEREISPFLAQ
jgi:hypothetical protein